MKRKYVLFLFFVIISSCKSNNNGNITNDTENIIVYHNIDGKIIRNYNGNRHIADYYFPENIFRENDVFVQTWYGRELDFLDGENLMNSNVNVIRFTCLRSWDNQFSIKLYFNDGHLIFSMSNYANALRLMIRDEEGNFKSPEKKIKIYKEIMVTDDKINSILNLVKNNFFYDIPTVEKKYGADGDIWIIETNLEGKYKVIERWCPKDDIIYEIGTYLISLSGEEIKNL